MGVSYRQAKRLWKRYREEGAAGLKHRSAGRHSNHARELKCRKKVLSWCGRSTVGRWASDLGRRWQRNTWLGGRTENRCGDVAPFDIA